MPRNESTNEGALLHVLYEAKMISDPVRFKRYARILFSSVDLSDARILDVGGGNGFLSFYVASMGARQVICLEPESDGSVHHERESFDSMRKRLGLGERVTLVQQGVEDIPMGDTLYDIILLHDSVNHLDESACTRLAHDPDAVRRYVQLLERIAGMMKPGATIIVCDCSAHSLFSDLGLKNPFAPTIEWNKHQTPETWIALLRTAGFDRPRLVWTPVLRLGWLGEAVTGNRGVAYLLRAHFCLTMSRCVAEGHDG